MISNSTIAEWVREVLRERTESMGTTSLAQFIIVAQGQESDPTAVFTALKRIAPVCGMAQRSAPIIMERGLLKGRTARPWTWLPPSEWANPLPDLTNLPPVASLATLVRELQDRVSALEARLNTYEQERA